MKKGFIVFLLLLIVPTVLAAEESLTDIIHKEMASTEERQVEELTRLRISLEDYQAEQAEKIDALEKDVRALQPQKQTPGVQQPSYLVALLSINILMLVVVVVLIFYLRRRYKAHEEFKEVIDEGFPVPEELVMYVMAALLKKKSLHEIRLDLAAKGWSPSLIEHAIHVAKRQSK